jgi:hypothetical protein
LRLIITLHLENIGCVNGATPAWHNDLKAGRCLMCNGWPPTLHAAGPQERSRLTYTGEWANEFQMEVEALSRSTWRRESLKRACLFHAVPFRNPLSGSMMANTNGIG